MRLQFWGATGEVTGSCTLLEVGAHRLLVDCGMYQGGRKSEARNAEPFPFDPATLDAVVLTHAHIDHAGRLPLLVRHGFHGPIYATPASRDLCAIMLPDSASIQMRDAEFLERDEHRQVLRGRRRIDLHVPHQRLLGAPARGGRVRQGDFRSGSRGARGDRRSRAIVRRIR